MSHLFPPPILISILTFMICILIAVPASHGDGDGDVDEQYMSCNSSHSCGTLQDIRYPFWVHNIRPQFCGLRRFELQCHDNEYATIGIGHQSFRVLEINNTHPIMRIVIADYVGRDCLESIRKSSISDPLFNYTEKVRNLSLFYDCSGDFSSQLGNNKYKCTSEGGVVIRSFYTVDNNDDSRLHNLSNSCSSVVKVPIQLTRPNILYLTEGRLIEALNQGFEVRYDAEDKLCSTCTSHHPRGICGSNQSSHEFSCLYPPPLGAGMMGILITCAIICIFRKKRNSSILRTVCCRKVTKSDEDIEAFIRNYGSLAPKRYSFPNVKKITNSFKDELGQGGYGRVYKGKLSDGRLVAVKLLNTSKGNGQEFINEVASISRTSHVNVITLLGFCLEGSKRALIYEFMPNGSLEKFVYNGNTSKPSGQHLGWDKMYEIVVGIAKGLEYLHRGCSTRILHFDIKPQNILLDEDFVPKISDFGLAKLCLKKESIVSMLEARGTIGYIAPEVFNRNFGEVSHKSDVYSYGMMIMELVGCKNYRDSGIDHSSEIYFPHWIYKHVEHGRELKLPGVVTSEENEIVKKMIIVGLWCMQTRPSNRPPMNRVIEMLQESNEALQIPPMPFLASPPRAPITSSSTVSTS
ncbi:LEAF RUST 10 DISEASE-RESISTANCE LOCUS RECEPTOR-LIKE PROTEIN KINASE-like 2.1 [Citrus sinensis]|uniref:LEAF RUST 10 DISEASE-RESISTANCE LOCUS RECEPTOR-LIKE PROTEIN KINASE-like 2.1 n=2 Tax=Citrus sinensis TaxID=2711 RepID=A0ACB8LZ38_CITSI|nr:LEAF RUST 10 DISEASE-RESISTANCE LOCUS RECEPTOR-LIKE PROTEIN KINASE-like 2.1 [Citrus sinensis]